MLNTEISATGAIRPVFAPRVRGIGQELLETGKVSQPGTGKLNQVIEKAFVPPTIEQIMMNTADSLNRNKRDNEYRILFVDYAFAHCIGATLLF